MVLNLILADLFLQCSHANITTVNGEQPKLNWMFNNSASYFNNTLNLCAL